jgi:hypothetical protein
MAKGLYLYTDDKGAAHAVEDWKLVPPRYQKRATFVPAQESAAASKLPPLSEFQGPLISAILPVVGLILIWRRAQGFFARAALIIVVAIWGYFKVFDKLVGMDALKTDARLQSERREKGSAEQPLAEGAEGGVVIVEPAKE